VLTNSLKILFISLLSLNLQSQESSNSIISEVSDFFDFSKSQVIRTLEALEKDVLLSEESEVDIEDKIDSLRIKVDKIMELKESEQNAPGFAILSMSRKDYRIKIDKILEDMEPILFDGEVVDYSTRIQRAKALITQSNQEIVQLNEDLLFNKEDGGFFSKSNEDLQLEKQELEYVIDRSKKLIDDLEYDLKKRLDGIGIKVSREQVRVLTSRVDGDDLAKTFAIFDVTKQISATLEALMKANSFESSTTVKYYGIYVLLSELLAYAQKSYINKIDDLYLPSIRQIEDDINQSIKFNNRAIRDASNEQNKKILRQNNDSNKFALEVADFYSDVLSGQKKQLERALKRTNEQVSVAYSTYDAAAVSFNLLSLINQSEDEFGKILNLQIPEIVPFENDELEQKFNELSEKIIERI
tara:strand:+ start:62 stop:1300 length:1239 start_codon:yes stop_codon:yes gene_type:complete